MGYSDQPPVPLYFQIKRHLLDQIAAGEFKVGDRLPSEAAIAEMFSASRMTARHAITELVNEGRLVRRQGVGTFVAEPRVERHLTGLNTLTEEYEQRGEAHKLWSLLLAWQQVPAAAGLAQRLGLAPGTPLVRICRVRYADQAPLAVQVLRIPAQAIRDLDPQTVAAGSLYPLLEKHLRCPLAVGEQAIQAVAASAFHARLLRVTPGSPLLLVTRDVQLATGQFAVLSRTHYRSDRYVLRLRLER